MAETEPQPADESWSDWFSSKVGYSTEEKPPVDPFAGFEGHLDEKQQTALAALLEAHGSDLGTSDLLRLLRARDFDVAKSAALLDSNQTFRAKYCPEKITAADVDNALKQGCWRMAGWSRGGQPIVLIRAALWRPQLYKDVDEYISLICYFMEKGLSDLAVRNAGKQAAGDGGATAEQEAPPVETVYVMFDMEGWSMSNSSMECIQALVNTVQDQYPECVPACSQLRVLYQY